MTSESVKILGNGEVKLVDKMGADEDILAAARISYNTNKERTYTTDENRNLIRYLIRHRHTSVFEMCEVKFYLKVPIFVARQLVRHRTANLNEVSGRYSELPGEFYVPDVEQCGPQSSVNNQGRSDVQNTISARHAQQNIRLSQERAHDVYDSLLNVSEVSREISRIVLPVSQFTEIVWKCDLHNFFHFCRLRMDGHAQYEIRVMAQAMFDLVRPHFPLATEAFSDYILNSKTLSAMEQTLLKTLLSRIEYLPTLDDATSAGMSKREHTEFCAWITSLIQKA